MTETEGDIQTHTHTNPRETTTVEKPKRTPVVRPFGTVIGTGTSDKTLTVPEVTFTSNVKDLNLTVYFKVSVTLSQTSYQSYVGLLRIKRFT